MQFLNWAMKIALTCGKRGGGIGDADNHVVLKIRLTRSFSYSVIVPDLLEH